MSNDANYSGATQNPNRDNVVIVSLFFGIALALLLGNIQWTLRVVFTSPPPELFSGECLTEWITLFYGAFMFLFMTKYYVDDVRDTDDFSEKIWNKREDCKKKEKTYIIYSWLLFVVASALVRYVRVSCAVFALGIIFSCKVFFINESKIIGNSKKSAHLKMKLANYKHENILAIVFCVLVFLFVSCFPEIFQMFIVYLPVYVWIMLIVDQVLTGHIL